MTLFERIDIIIPNFLVFEPNVLYILLIKRAYGSGFCQTLPRRPKIDVFRPRYT